MTWMTIGMKISRNLKQSWDVRPVRIASNNITCLTTGLVMSLSLKLHTSIVFQLTKEKKKEVLCDQPQNESRAQLTFVSICWAQPIRQMMTTRSNNRESKLAKASDTIEVEHLSDLTQAVFEATLIASSAIKKGG